MIDDKLQGLIVASFIGDALSLGPHWIYDTDLITKYFYPIEGYTDPIHTPYHQGKKAGDFTHYGDQALALLKSIVDKDGFDLIHFKKSWLDFVGKETMYLDHATKDSLTKLISTNTGSNSNELGGLSRSGPMFLLDDLSEEDFENRLIEEIKMTHDNELLEIISRFLARVIREILKGVSIEDALDRHSNIHTFIYDSYELALADNNSIVSAIKANGQSCSSEFGLPGLLFVLTKTNDFKEALIHNAYAGGDSASRAMILGMIYGARDGFKQLPKEWIKSLNKLDEISDLLDLPRN